MSDGAPIMVRIIGDSHRVEVRAVAGGEFRVKGDARVEHSDLGITVDEAQTKLKVRVPEGADLVVGTSNGRVVVTGTVGHLALVSEAGRVEVERASSVDIRTETAKVEVGQVSGACRIRSKSGRVEVASCAAADVASKTGRIDLHHIDGVVDAHSVSGRIELTLEHPHDVRAETLTGQIEVSLPPGTIAFRPDGPNDRRLPPPGTTCTVLARSESGEVVVATR